MLGQDWRPRDQDILVAGPKGSWILDFPPSSISILFLSLFESTHDGEVRRDRSCWVEIGRKKGLFLFLPFLLWRPSENDIRPTFPFSMQHRTYCFLIHFVSFAQKKMHFRFPHQQKSTKRNRILLFCFIIPPPRVCVITTQPRSSFSFLPPPPIEEGGDRRGGSHLFSRDFFPLRHSPPMQ